MTDLKSEEKLARSIPRVFLSYAWEDDVYRKWVLGLAAALRRDGIYACVDEWDRKDGHGFIEFMNAEARNADRILVVGSPDYRQRVHDHEEGKSSHGVGWEQMLVGIYRMQGDRSKLVLALGRGKREAAFPDSLLDQIVYDLTNSDSQCEYEKLLDDLHRNRPKGPPVKERIHKTRMAVEPGFAAPTVGDSKHSLATVDPPFSSVPAPKAAVQVEGEESSTSGGTPPGEAVVKQIATLLERDSSLLRALGGKLLQQTRADAKDVSRALFPAERGMTILLELGRQQGLGWELIEEVSAHIAIHAVASAEAVEVQLGKPDAAASSHAAAELVAAIRQGRVARYRVDNGALYQLSAEFQIETGDYRRSAHPNQIEQDLALQIRAALHLKDDLPSDFPLGRLTAELARRAGSQREERREYWYFVYRSDRVSGEARRAFQDLQGRIEGLHFIEINMMAEEHPVVATVLRLLSEIVYERRQQAQASL